MPKALLSVFLLVLRRGWIALFLVAGLNGCIKNNETETGTRDGRPTSSVSNVASQFGIAGGEAPAPPDEVHAPVRVYGDSLEAELVINASYPMESGDDLIAILTIHNRSGETLTIRGNASPLSGEITADYFKVWRDGETIDYKGIVTLPDPDEERLTVTIPAGGSHQVSEAIKLLEFYPMTAPGFYRMTYDQRVEVFIDRSDGRKQLGIVTVLGSGTWKNTALQANRTLDEARFVAGKQELSGFNLAFNSLNPNKQSKICSDEVKTVLEWAKEDGVVRMNESIAHVNQVIKAGGGDLARYKTWFAPYNARVAGHVKKTMECIRSSFRRQIGYVCEPCQYSGYVWPDQPYVIYFCPKWYKHMKMSAPRPHTHWHGLVHEASHWNVCGGTRDHQYGEQASAWAAANPSRAHENADGYRFFAINSRNEGVFVGETASSQPKPPPQSAPKPNPQSSSACSTSSKDMVQKAYIGYYGRCADGEGQNYWCKRLEKAGGSLDGIISEFGTSKEFTDKFAKLPDRTLISNLYKHYFDRTAEAEGVNFYTGLLKKRADEFTARNRTSKGAREYALSKIALDILMGASGDDVTTLAAKVADCNSKIKK